MVDLPMPKAPTDNLYKFGAVLLLVGALGAPTAILTQSLRVAMSEFALSQDEDLLAVRREINVANKRQAQLEEASLARIRDLFDRHQAATGRQIQKAIKEHEHAQTVRERVLAIIDAIAAGKTVRTQLDELRDLDKDAASYVDMLLQGKRYADELDRMINDPVASKSDVEKLLLLKRENSNDLATSRIVAIGQEEQTVGLKAERLQGLVSQREHEVEEYKAALQKLQATREKNRKSLNAEALEVTEAEGAVDTRRHQVAIYRRQFLYFLWFGIPFTVASFVGCLFCFRRWYLRTQRRQDELLALQVEQKTRELLDFRSQQLAGPPEIHLPNAD